MKRAQEAKVYQLKVSLREIRPPIWRRILVPGDWTLAKLHFVLQAAMGWEDDHLHLYLVDGVKYGMPDPEFDTGTTNERRHRLERVARLEGMQFRYIYDFGDDWDHDVLVEKILPAAGVAAPVCLAGCRSCPPEDCGGPWGYADLLAVLNDPGHRRYEDLKEWAGEDFDPEAFELDGVNSMLAAMLQHG